MHVLQILSDTGHTPKSLEILRESCNQISEKFGLSLSQNQIENIEKRRVQTLKETGRIEFGEGVIQKLIYAFCDSPYISASDYEDTLIELQDLFYHFKHESMESLSDDELIEAMAYGFNHKARGSLSYLSETYLEHISRLERGGFTEEEEELCDDDDCEW